MLDTARTRSQKCNPEDAASAHDRCCAPSGRRWCVVATQPRAERRAHASLHRAGFHAYVPWITVRHVNRTWHTKPLWPGYAFVELDLAKPWSPVIRAPGVFQLLMNGQLPAICPDHALQAVQSALQAAEALAGEKERWKPGAVCTAILGGGIRVDGIVTAIRGQKATIATIMLGGLRELVVDVDRLRLRED